MNNIRLNNFLNAYPHQVALSNVNGLSSLGLPSACDANQGTASLINKNSQASSITVQTNTLDSFCDSLGLKKLDFLKIDVEGAEHLVLKGGMNTLGRFKPTIVFEANGESLPICLSLLSSLGYQFSDLNGGPLLSDIAVPHDVLAVYPYPTPSL